jgi:glycyl-tRNA synthetase
MAPYKCSVLPLSANDEFKPLTRIVSQLLTNHGITHKVDDSSGSIGRRYARTDEIAIPFALTIDFESLKEPTTLTFRERESMQQVRVKLNEIPQLINDLCESKLNWNTVYSTYPVQLPPKDSN